jgi:hypothetical protein
MTDLPERFVKAGLEALAAQYEIMANEIEELRHYLRFVRTNGLKHLEANQIVEVFGETSRRLAEAISSDKKRPLPRGGSYD